jgi:hypothetical protein
MTVMKQNAENEFVVRLHVRVTGRVMNVLLFLTRKLVTLVVNVVLVSALHI